MLVTADNQTSHINHSSESENKDGVYPLSELLSSQEFIERFNEMVSHARRNISESGLAISLANDGLHISHVQRSPKRIALFDYLSESTDIEKLITSELERLKDFDAKPAITIHTHPQRHNGDFIYTGLSTSDIDVWADQSNKYNQSLIEGIFFIPKKGICSLLLIQRQPNTQINNIYQSWQEGDSMGSLFDLLERSNIRFTEIKFDPKNGFNSEQIAKLDWQIT
ncbi:hypothetical protein GYA49_04855 [Candidatus Beckwithbacteria bacterium]|nr:hypothetical protein [Candidatus Beckwithbacteria bacterium]